MADHTRSRGVRHSWQVWRSVSSLPSHARSRHAGINCASTSGVLVVVCFSWFPLSGFLSQLGALGALAPSRQQPTRYWVTLAAAAALAVVAGFSIARMRRA